MGLTTQVASCGLADTVAPPTVQLRDQGSRVFNGKERTEELAVMIDTFHPLRMTTYARGYEDEQYVYSWLPYMHQAAA